MGYPSLTGIFNRRREKFIKNVPLIGNQTLQILSDLVLQLYRSFYEMCNKVSKYTMYELALNFQFVLKLIYYLLM